MSTTLTLPDGFVRCPFNVQHCIPAAELTAHVVQAHQHDALSGCIGSLTVQQNLPRTASIPQRTSPQKRQRSQSHVSFDSRSVSRDTLNGVAVVRATPSTRELDTAGRTLHLVFLTRQRERKRGPAGYTGGPEQPANTRETEDAVRALLAGFGRLERFRFVDRAHCFFATYERPEAAAAALLATRGGCTVLGDVDLRVSLAMSKNAPGNAPRPAADEHHDDATFARSASSSLMVHNLPAAATEDLVLRRLHPHRPVLVTLLPPTASGGAPMGVEPVMVCRSAVVEMGAPRAAAAALHHLEGSTLGGRPLSSSFV